MIGIHDSDLFWLAFIAAFLCGMGLRMVSSRLS
jgi:hypothetical protein